MTIAPTGGAASKQPGKPAAKRAPAVPKIFPVRALKEQTVALDAAMLVAVSGAEIGAVHKLRTTTRRVEAQMTLLDLLARGDKPLLLPEHKHQADAVRRRLRVVRRAAGAVRDLDVQRDAVYYDAPAKAEVHKGTPGDTMRKQAKQLRKHLEGKREGEKAKLIAVLKAEEALLAGALRELEQTVKPAIGSTVASATMVERIEHWFITETRSILRLKAKSKKSPTEALRSAIENLNEDALHTVRKAAKLCRYMAESAPKGSAARSMSDRFEAMQEAGGRWHDWLLLEDLSRDFHGKSAPLTMRYMKHRDAALAEYHLKLAELLPTVAKS